MRLRGRAGRGARWLAAAIACVVAITGVVALVALAYAGRMGRSEAALSVGLLPGIVVGSLSSKLTWAALDRGHTRAAVLLVTLAATAGVADEPKAEDSKQGCCRQNNADIVRWHKNADRLHRQFKPREAVGELQKILQIDGGNFEALIKMARAFVDIGSTTGGGLPASKRCWIWAAESGKL